MVIGRGRGAAAPCSGKWKVESGKWKVARADRGVGPYRGTPPMVHGCVVGADDPVRPVTVISSGIKADLTNAAGRSHPAALRFIASCCCKNTKPAYRAPHGRR